MRTLTGWVLGIVAVLFLVSVWLPFVHAQDVAQDAGAVITVGDLADGLDLGTLALLAILLVSEGLAFIPKLQANGVLHAVILGLRQALKRRAVPVVLLAVLALGLSACASMKGTMLDGSFCTIQSDVEARTAMADLVALMPDGPDKQKAQSAMALADVSATALCELRRAYEGRMQMAQAQPTE